MNRLRREGEEVPKNIRVLQVGARVAFLRVNKIRELQRVANEEYGCIVSRHIIVAFLCIKLHCESARVAFCISRPFLTTYSGKASEDISTLTNLR